MAHYEQYVTPPRDFILVSSGAPASDVTLPANCRGLLVGGAGSLNVTMTETGENRNDLPFVQGQNPGFFSQVRSGGTATDIWAII